MWWLSAHKDFLSKRLYPGLPEIHDLGLTYMIIWNTRFRNVPSAHLVIPRPRCGQGFMFKFMDVAIRQPSYILPPAFIFAPSLPLSLPSFSHHLTFFTLIPFFCLVVDFALNLRWRWWAKKILSRPVIFAHLSPWDNPLENLKQLFPQSPSITALSSGILKRP